jgi:hypothetical protein
MSSSLPPKTLPKSTTGSTLGSMPAKMPSEVVRGLVSLWLIFHFFCIGLALAFNPNFEPPTSQLMAKLRMTFSAYLYPIWLRSPHNYAWTSGEAPDADQLLIAQWTDSSGSHAVQFPAENTHGEERERGAALARWSAQPIYSELQDRDLLAKIGEGILKQSDAQEVKFRIRRHNPLTMQDAAADDPGQRDPNNPRMYTEIDAGKVTLNSNGEGEVTTPQQALDVAPVTNPSQRAAGPNQERSGTKSKGNRGAGSGASGQEMPPLPPADASKKPGLEMLKGISQPERRSP